MYIGDQDQDTTSNEQRSIEPHLEPLSYHRSVVNLLQEKEGAIWAWAASQSSQPGEIESTRHAMLQATYRLEASAHSTIHEHCRQAMTALSIDAPVTLYQASSGEMNASLCYIPNEVHIIFYGPILEKLSSEEIIAVIGHELSHYLLWSLEGGAFHAANSVLEHALAYPVAKPSHIETARLFALCTEFFADRGAAIAARSTKPAIATLIKTLTGLSSVDADAYLRQAAELDKAANTSQGVTHPEIFLRAQALDKWWNGDSQLDQWIDRRLHGPLSLASLDLPQQYKLTEMTCKFFAGFLSDKDLRSDAVITQIRRFFPDWSPGGPTLDAGSLSPENIDGSVRDYFIALILDLAMADRDIKDEILTAGAKAARGFDALDAFRSALKRDLKMTKSAVDKIVALIDKAA